MQQQGGNGLSSFQRSMPHDGRMTKHLNKVLTHRLGCEAEDESRLAVTSDCAAVQSWTVSQFSLHCTHIEVTSGAREYQGQLRTTTVSKRS